jgi:hypothetical protein
VVDVVVPSVKVVDVVVDEVVEVISPGVVVVVVDPPGEVVVVEVVPSGAVEVVAFRDVVVEEPLRVVVVAEPFKVVVVEVPFRVVVVVEVLTQNNFFLSSLPPGHPLQWQETSIAASISRTPDDSFTASSNTGRDTFSST